MEHHRIAQRPRVRIQSRCAQTGRLSRILTGPTVRVVHITVQRARATISELSISHSVRLDQVLLLSSEKVTLVFAHEDQAKSYREIQISDLPNLKEQGIHLHFEPFLKQMLESGKYEHGDDRVPHQPPAYFEVQSIATSFIGTDEGEERDSTVEGADCVGSGSDPGRTLKLPICDRR